MFQHRGAAVEARATAGLSEAAERDQATEMSTWMLPRVAWE